MSSPPVESLRDELCPQTKERRLSLLPDGKVEDITKDFWTLTSPRTPSSAPFKLQRTFGSSDVSKTPSESPILPSKSTTPALCLSSPPPPLSPTAPANTPTCPEASTRSHEI